MRLNEALGRASTGLVILSVVLMIYIVGLASGVFALGFSPVLTFWVIVSLVWLVPEKLLPAYLILAGTALGYLALDFLAPSDAVLPPNFVGYTSFGLVSLLCFASAGLQRRRSPGGQERG